MDASEKIIVALDTTANQARELGATLSGHARWLKVGMTLYYRAGPGIVSELKDLGYQVFVDLKLHDIPHQVRGAARAVALAGADMFTVHASGGLAMMQAACEGAEEALSVDGAQHNGKHPLCLAVTVLTSLDTDTLASVGVATDMPAQVKRLAALAKQAGMDGLVCSPQETELVRQEVGHSMTVVTPGVRPAGSTSGDQARVMTPAAALRAGADYLVIGRPVTEAADPRAAFEAIVKEMRA